MFCYFYLAKNHKVVNKSTNAEQKGKQTDLDFLEFICVSLTQPKNNQALLDNINNQLLLKTKLFTGRHIPTLK